MFGLKKNIPESGSDNPAQEGKGSKFAAIGGQTNQSGGGSDRTAAAAGKQTSKLEISDAKKRIAQFIKAGSELPESGETNLIKGRAVIILDWRKKYYFLALNVFLALASIAIMFIGILGWSKVRESSLKDVKIRITQQDAQIKNLEEKNSEVFVFQKKLKLVKDLIGGHVHWSNFFRMLERNTLPDVYYDSFSGDLGGVYNISARAKDFDTVANQMQSFGRSKYIKEAVTLEGKTVYSAKKAIDPKTGESKEDAKTLVVFKLDLTIDPSIFISYEE